MGGRPCGGGRDLGLEFCNRYETNVLNTTEQTLAFIEDVDRPNVMAHLDVYHMNIEEVSFADAVHAAAAAGRFGYVHLGESHRGAGYGVRAVQGVLRGAARRRLPGR